jgi:hypothetical protein
VNIRTSTTPNERRDVASADDDRRRCSCDDQRATDPGVGCLPDAGGADEVVRDSHPRGSTTPGVLMVSANHGFEGSDTPYMGASVVVTTDDDETLAEATADEIAAAFRSLIVANTWTGLDVDEALDEAYVERTDRW